MREFKPSGNNTRNSVKDFLFSFRKEEIASSHHLRSSPSEKVYNDGSNSSRIIYGGSQSLTEKGESSSDHLPSNSKDGDSLINEDTQML